MRSRCAPALALLATGALAGLALAGCGGGGRARATGASPDGGTIRMALSGVLTLDPARAVTAQQTELDWALYTGLVSYRHASGEAGTELIAGVASALPRVSDGGRLYTVTLRRGLRFSDGRPLRAGDVVASIERVIRTRDSPVRPLLLDVLSGAAAFAADRAPSVRGLAAEDANGRVTIRLRRSDPGFDALLAEPALGIVPAGTPVREPSGHPPPGIGPYRLTAVHARRSFTLARNPYWTALPGIPAGRVDVEVILSPHARASALAVLNGVLDVEDPAQPLLPAALAWMGRLGEERTVTGGPPLAGVFLDTATRPFDRALAREAVLSGLGAQTLPRTAARGLPSTCALVPVLTGSPTPDGCPAEPGAGSLPAAYLLAGARSLLARSGTAGTPLVVWAPRSGPERGWMGAEAALLRAIGYDARVGTVPDAAYRSALAALVPRPVARLTAPTRTSSAGRSRLAPRSPKARAAPVTAVAVVEGRLGAAVHVPAAGAIPVLLGPEIPLRSARRAAHRVMFAQPMIPELMSRRMDAPAPVVDPVEGLDFTSLRLR
jgi:peptide/nickel transport system substrate-binding protein